jgi:Fructose-1-6-bisphosphatase, N-terminal domain
VNRAGISNLTGLAGQANVQGEDQKKLDVVSNQVFCNALRASGRTGIIASEEEDEPVAVEETFSGTPPFLLRKQGLPFQGTRSLRVLLFKVSLSKVGSRYDASRKQSFILARHTCSQPLPRRFSRGWRVGHPT